MNWELDKAHEPVAQRMCAEEGWEPFGVQTVPGDAPYIWIKRPLVPESTWRGKPVSELDDDERAAMEAHFRSTTIQPIDDSPAV